MATWTKPNGSTIELNEEKATTEKAKELGWTQGKSKAKRKASAKAKKEAE